MFDCLISADIEIPKPTGDWGMLTTRDILVLLVRLSDIYLACVRRDRSSENANLEALAIAFGSHLYYCKE